MKKIVFIIIIIVSLYIIKNFLYSIYSLWQKQDLIVRAQKELAQEKKKNQELKKKLSEVRSREFIEEQARDKLFLARPEESEVVISKNLLELQPGKKSEPSDTRPNWKKWFDLFF